jgi:hypothetical protein
LLDEEVLEEGEVDLEDELDDVDTSRSRFLADEGADDRLPLDLAGVLTFFRIVVSDSVSDERAIAHFQS